MHEWPFLTVVAGVLLSLLVVAIHHFRRGAVLLAASLVLGAFLRLLLPSRAGGLLVVRSKVFDVCCYAIFGLALTILALAVPPPS